MFEAKQRASILKKKKHEEELARIRKEDTNDGNGANDKCNEVKDLISSLMEGRDMKGIENLGEEAPYDVVGVEKDATQSQIRKAYRKRSLFLHPDKNINCKVEAGKAFEALVAAYEILSVPDKRSAFDDHGGSEAFETLWGSF